MIVKNLSKKIIGNAEKHLLPGKTAEVTGSECWVRMYLGCGMLEVQTMEEPVLEPEEEEQQEDTDATRDATTEEDAVQSDAEPKDEKKKAKKKA